MYHLAAEICSFLKLPLDSVLVHWACTKIQHSASVPDEALCDLVVAKLGTRKGVSYATVATAADKVRPYSTCHVAGTALLFSPVYRVCLACVSVQTSPSLCASTFFMLDESLPGHDPTSFSHTYARTLSACGWVCFSSWLLCYSGALPSTAHGVQAGRRPLATLLLEHERVLSERVKLYVAPDAGSSVLRLNVCMFADDVGFLHSRRVRLHGTRFFAVGCGCSAYSLTLTLSPHSLSSLSLLTLCPPLHSLSSLIPHSFLTLSPLSPLSPRSPPPMGLPPCTCLRCPLG
jgi:hypothetical protein